MKKITFLILFILAAAAALLMIYKGGFGEKNKISPGDSTSSLEKIGTAQSPEAPAEEEKNPKSSGFTAPLANAGTRVTKKPFGIFVTPQNSPVSPERFRGYHTAADFEIFPGEENVELAVKAVCGGKLLSKRNASGYGGVAVESCELAGEPIIVVYGHVKLESINYKIGDRISAGDTLGILGAAGSRDTDGERKHLHLGFRKGSAQNILGYVQNKSELSGWLDPCQYVCGN
jgi:murein DD-endopeptidase MepM/ murein hydrolase activator NlpD